MRISASRCRSLCRVALIIHIPPLTIVSESARVYSCTRVASETREDDPICAFETTVVVVGPFHASCRGRASAPATTLDAQCGRSLRARHPAGHARVAQYSSFRRRSSNTFFENVNAKRWETQRPGVVNVRPAARSPVAEAQKCSLGTLLVDVMGEASDVFPGPQASSVTKNPQRVLKGRPF